jgi:hypothetical protein
VWSNPSKEKEHLKMDGREVVEDKKRGLKKEGTHDLLFN